MSPFRSRERATMRTRKLSRCHRYKPAAATFADTRNKALFSPHQCVPKHELRGRQSPSHISLRFHCLRLKRRVRATCHHIYTLPGITHTQSRATPYKARQLLRAKQGNFLRAKVGHQKRGNHMPRTSGCLDPFRKLGLAKDLKQKKVEATTFVRATEPTPNAYRRLSVPPIGRNARQMHAGNFLCPSSSSFPGQKSFTVTVKTLPSHPRGAAQVISLPSLQKGSAHGTEGSAGVGPLFRQDVGQGSPKLSAISYQEKKRLSAARTTGR